MNDWSSCNNQTSRMKLLLFLCVVIGGWFLNRSIANREICRRFKFSKPSNGFALVGHVFANITLFIGPHTDNNCRNRCIMEQKCRSINIGQVRKDKVSCQLSDSDQSKHPKDLKPRDGFLYFGIVSNCDMTKQCEGETAEPTENTPQVALNLHGSLVSKVGEVAYGRDSNSNSSSDNSSSSRSDGLSSSFSNSDSLSLVNSERETDSGSDGGGRSNGGEELNRDDQNSRGCAASPCGKGTCQDVNGGYSCVCPLEWQGSNCKDFVDNCFSNSVGVANPDIISDQQMTASSQREVSFQASHGRLNGQGWCARNGTSRGQWLRVDFNRTVDLCAVSTQGIEGSWVTEFKLSYITTIGNWRSYRGADGKVVLFHRTGNSSMVDQHRLPVPLSTRSIRFRPTRQHLWNCLRVEVYGISDPCYYYREIQQSRRNRDYQTSHVKCDSDYLPANKTWYRFVGANGTRLPTACVPEGHCNADSPGWLNGHHPNVTQGVVNMKVCFHKNADCCHYHEFISVKNCGSFYSYGLVQPPACNLRYCTDH